MTQDVASGFCLSQQRTKFCRQRSALAKKAKPQIRRLPLEEKTGAISRRQICDRAKNTSSGRQGRTILTR
jgi:hypothetical protein